jgi:methylase of polypeptide subunit release factors
LVTAIDLDPLACQNTKANTLLHNLSVRVEQGDLFAPVSGETFNAVIANLPFWPDAPGTLPLGHAFSAGPGYPLLRRFVAEAPQHAQRSYTVLSESFADFPAARTALGPSMRLLRREWFRGEWMNLFLLER